jgi:hypothetical protein
MLAFVLNVDACFASTTARYRSSAHPPEDNVRNYSKS